MGSELIILYIPIAFLTLGILLFLIYRPTSRWIGLPLLLLSIAAGTWLASTEDSAFAQAAFFAIGFVASCIFSIPLAYLVRWLVRRFSAAATSR